MEQATVSAGPSEKPMSTPEPHDDAAKGKPLRRLLSAALVTLGLLALKAKALLFLVLAKFKLLLVNPFEGFGLAQFSVAAGSIVVSLAAYARKWGLAIGIGLVVILVIHEIGHAIVIRAKGLRTGALVLIPFVGGAVTLKRQPRSAYTDAQIALAGPIAGAIASLISYAIYRSTSDPLYLLIAYVGFLLNLFNLTPVGPLDGGRIAAAITKWMWVFGAIILFGITLWQPNPILIVLIVLSFFQIYRAIGEERRRRFYNVTVAQRGRIAAIYFILVTFLAYETLHTWHLTKVLAAAQ